MLAPLRRRHVTLRKSFTALAVCTVASLLCLTLLAAPLWRSAASSEQRLPAARSAVLAEPWQADYAFLIKTGCLTAQRRVPMQLLTFLSGIRDFILIGAEPDAAGDVEVIDVATPALEQLQAFHAALSSSRGSGTSSDSDSSGSGGGAATPRRLLWRNERETRGYIMDRYKNIPGWRALRDAFPAAKWYVSIDDDTYWLMDNFRRFIARFDPDVPQYLGNPHAFRPSRNLILGLQFEGGMMPHGGEGMIMSRRAMQLMMRQHETCMRKFVEATYMFGDVQTTLCLRDAGVAYNESAIEYETLLLNYPPGVADPDRKRALEGLAAAWPQQHPCARVFAIHHLLPEQMQLVYDAEAAAPAGQPTYADLWRALRAPLDGNASAADGGVVGGYFQLQGVQTAGQPLAALAAASPGACADACSAQSDCMQWTHRHDTGECSLRSTFDRVHVPRKRLQLVSGAHLGRFRCNDRDQ